MLTTMNKNKLTSRNITVKFQNTLGRGKNFKTSQSGGEKRFQNRIKNKNGTGLFSGNTGSQKTSEECFQN